MVRSHAAAQQGSSNQIPTLPENMGIETYFDQAGNTRCAACSHVVRRSTATRMRMSLARHRYLAQQRAIESSERAELEAYRAEAARNRNEMVTQW